MPIYSYYHSDNIEWGTRGRKSESLPHLFDEKIEKVFVYIFFNILMGLVLVGINGFWLNQGYVVVAVVLFETTLFAVYWLFAFFHITAFSFTFNLKDLVVRDSDPRRYYKSTS